VTLSGDVTGLSTATVVGNLAGGVGKVLGIGNSLYVQPTIGPSSIVLTGGSHINSTTIENWGAVTMNYGVNPGNTVQNAESNPRLYMGVGAPSSAAIDGSYYFRTDGGTSTHIYFHTSGSWTAIV
jgi:hypothetical protein